MGKVRILSRSSQQFTDRVEAGQLLAHELSNIRTEKPVILAIPRGGVIVGREIARELGAELDVVLARKLRTPGQLELAMGAVAEDGSLYLNQSLVLRFGISEGLIQEEKIRQLAELSRRTQLFRNIRPKVPLKGRIAVITDDGLATGATTFAAIHSIRQEKPERLIAAFPVAPEESIIELAELADEVICLRTPPIFMAVGQFYRRFQQIEDNEVLEILKESLSAESNVVGK